MCVVFICFICSDTVPLSSYPVHGLTRLLCGGRHIFLFESYPAPSRHLHHLQVADWRRKQDMLQLAKDARAQAGLSTEKDKREAAGMSGDQGEKSDEEAQQELDKEQRLALQTGPPIYLVPLHGLEMERALNRSSSGMEEEEDEDEEDEEDDEDVTSRRIHPIYRLLASTRRAAASSSSRLEFALLTSYQYGSHNVRRHIVSPRSLRECTLKFLPSRVQNHAMRGEEREGASYVTSNEQQQNNKIIGDVAFTKKKKAKQQQQQDEIASPSSSSSPSLTNDTLDVAWSILHPYVYSPHHVDPWPVSTSLTSSGSNPLLTRPDCQFDSDGETVFVESDAEVYGTVASQTRGMMSGLLAPTVAAVTGEFDSIVGGFVINAAQEFLPTGVADSLTDQLTRELPHRIARIIIPTIGRTMSEALPPATVAKITPYASHGISYKTSHDIVEDLVKNLEINIHRLVDVEMPKNLAILCGHIIPHLLDRSVTHSVTAALTHTLAHSPLHDSFCLQCYNHQKFCEFCHFSPNKIFFNLYYAGYYSTYFGDYYKDWFTNLLTEDRIRAIEPAQENTQTRAHRYRRIYSDKGEQVTRTWRRGEPDEHKG